MRYPYDPVKLKVWCDDLDRAYRNDPRPWGQYDAQIMQTVSDYNMYLSQYLGTGGLTGCRLRRSPG